MPLGALAQSSDVQGILGIIDKLARAPLGHVLLVVAICTGVRLLAAPILAGRASEPGGCGLLILRLVNEFFDAVIYAGIVVFMLVRPFLIQTFHIPTGSMLETLQIGDFIVANKLVYRLGTPEPDDIVVFRPPKRGLIPGTSATDYIKRCVGVAGDVVEIRRGQLFRNGKKIDEPYVTMLDEMNFKVVRFRDELIPVRWVEGIANIHGMVADEYEVTTPEEMDELIKGKPQPIPKGHFLPMGDNRAQSYDGRFWGFVPYGSLIGRSEVIWMPVPRWRLTR